MLDTSHILAVLPEVAVAKYFPSGLKATPFTLSCWSSVVMSLIEGDCQIEAVLSALAVAKYFRSLGLKATPYTLSL
jgi:hypothetical protein